MGRFVIWTKSAFEKLDSIYGTYTEKSQSKVDYILPRAGLTNSDIARVINSDEVQSVVRPPPAQGKKLPRKKNPLKNLAAMLRLNPYALIHRRAELKASANPVKAKVSGAEKKARKAAGRAFYAKASLEGDKKF